MKGIFFVIKNKLGKEVCKLLSDMYIYKNKTILFKEPYKLLFYVFYILFKS